MLSVFIVLSGCGTLIIRKPTLLDIQGTWESIVQASYYQLKIEEKGMSYLAVVYDKKLVKLYKLDTFGTHDEGFSAKFVDTEGDESVEVAGSLMLGRLALENKTNKKEKIWFLKTKNLEKFRNLANDRISKEEHKKTFSSKPSLSSDQ